jgi:hypothetical protein
VLVFDKSFRFIRFVRFLERRGIVRLDGGIPTIVQPEALDAIGLAFFVYYVARTMTVGRRVTFAPLKMGTALIVEPLPLGQGLFLRGPRDGDYAPQLLPPAMSGRATLCAGHAFIHANWATYMAGALPALPVCAGCSDGSGCATLAWTAERLRTHTTESLGLVGGHAIVIEATPAVFELVGTEPVADEPDMEAGLAGAKRLDMKYFDAYLALDLGALLGAKVYIPNTTLAKPFPSPYECDVVVYDDTKSLLSIVETSMGVGADDEAIVMRSEGAPPTVAPERLHTKHFSHSGLASLGVQHYRYVYASIGELNFGENERSQGAYARHVLGADPPMRLIELARKVPDLLKLREPRWWNSEVIHKAFVTFRDDIRDAAHA